MTQSIVQRCVIYTRNSTPGQADNFSPESQLIACRAYAQANGMTIVAELFDNFTGTTLDRPQLKELRALVDKRAVDHVIAHESDRLSRGGVAQSALLREEFKRARVRLHYATSGAVAYTASGEMMSNFKAMIAEEEVRRIRERTTRGRAQKVKNGIMLNAKQPVFGYDAGDKMWTVNKEQAAVVRQIYQWYADGLGTPTIVHKLNDAGIPTPTQQRRSLFGHVTTQWALSTVAKILAQEAYAGCYHWTVIGPEDQWGFETSITASSSVPQIVDRALWDAVAHKREENASMARRNGRREYLLRGMVTCWCGRALAGATRQYSYYRCTSARCYPSPRCEMLDSKVWAYFLEVTDEEKIRAYYQLQRMDSSAVVEQYERDAQGYRHQLEQVEIRRRRLVDAVGAGLLDHDDIAEQKAEIDRRKASAQRELDAIAQKLAALDHSAEKEEDTVAKAREIRERIASGLSPVGQHNALRAMDTAIVMHHDDTGGTWAMVKVDGLEPKRIDLDPPHRGNLMNLKNVKEKLQRDRATDI